MNFNKKSLIILSLSLIMLILIPPIPSFAKSFTDVPASHWAYSYIDEMSNMEYIKGYPDGSYKPMESLTYLETLSLLSRLLAISDEEKMHVEKFRPIVNNFKVVEWAQEAVMRSLYKEVISEIDLKLASDQGMIEVGTKVAPSRLLISIHLAKAMGLDHTQENPQNLLQYKDLEKVDPKYHKTLQKLILAGVLNPKGTGTGNFEPEAKIQRDAMAKMMLTAYAYLLKNPPVEEDKVVLAGKIIEIFELGTDRLVTVKDKENEETELLLDSTYELTINGNLSKITDLFIGQDIEFIGNGDKENKVFDRPRKVRIRRPRVQNTSTSALPEEEEDIVGTISEITEFGKIKLITIRDDLGDEFQVLLDSTYELSLDNYPITIDDLFVGEVFRLYKNGDSKNKVFYRPGKVRVGKITLRTPPDDGDKRGIITAIVEAGENRIVTVIDKSKEETELLLDSTAEIISDDGIIKISDLFIDQEIQFASNGDSGNKVFYRPGKVRVGKITLRTPESDNIIVDIMNKGEYSLLKVKDKSNNETELLIDYTTEITMDDKPIKITDLLVGQEIDFVSTGYSGNKVFYRPGKVRVGRITLRR